MRPKRLLHASDQSADRVARRRASSSVNDLTGQGIGRSVTFAAVALLMGAALLLSVTGFAGADPNDPGLGDVAIFFSPVLAAASGLVIGLVLLILAAFRMINLSLLGAVGATVTGLVGGPLAYLLVGYLISAVLTALIAPMPILIDGVLAFGLPVACGIAASLYMAWRLRQEHRAAPSAQAASRDIRER